MPTLDWIGKKAVVGHHTEVPFHLLRCNRGLSVGDPGSGNLLVQGDNLVALKALLPYYGGQVKCIYIDPPYNTGNEKWVYNDNVTSPEMRDWLGTVVGGEAEDLSRHDKWLCMMYPRLCLLREMLSEDGAIFISIDDNEIGHLRLIMDAIFGERNFVATIIWEKVYSPKSTAKHLSENHDFVVLYAKDKNVWSRKLLPRTEAQDKRYRNPDGDPRGPWKPGDLSARNPYSAGVYPITTPSGRVIQGPPKGMYWRVSKEKLAEMDKDKRIWWGKDGGNVPAIKRFRSEVAEGVVPETIWTYHEAGHTQEAKKELLSLLPDADQVFITPKPTRLVQRILQLATDKDSLVLDSFAGSGTTGHAVLKQNAEDGGTRRCILVEMDEGIAENIAAQRMRRAVEGYGGQPALGEGFRYCELGPTLFEAEGQIRKEVSFDELAHHVFFMEMGEPLPKRANGKSPMIGTAKGTAVYLLYNGILGDKDPTGGNVLTSALLTKLPKHDGPKVVFGTSCRISQARLDRELITFRQIPYEVRTS